MVTALITYFVRMSSVLISNTFMKKFVVTVIGSHFVDVVASRVWTVYVGTACRHGPYGQLLAMITDHKCQYGVTG